MKHVNDVRGDLVMCVRGLNNVGRAVQTDLTSLRYTLANVKQKKCWELLAENLTAFNNMQQAVQMDAAYNIQHCCTHLHGALSVDTL